MEQPRHILKTGARIKTNQNLDGAAGMNIGSFHLSGRKPNQAGAIIRAIVGHAGDVYLVRHDGVEDVTAPYCFAEFELEKKELKTGLLTNPNPRWWLVWVENEEIGVRQDLQVEASAEHDARVLAAYLVSDKWKVVSVEPFAEGA